MVKKEEAVKTEETEETEGKEEEMVTDKEETDPRLYGLKSVQWNPDKKDLTCSSRYKYIYVGHFC